MATPQQEIDALLGELDAEFSKKPKVKSDTDIARARNRAFHERHPQTSKGAASYAKAQLEHSAFRNFYDWDAHRLVTTQEAATPEHTALPDLEWTPEARITTIVSQHCATCAQVVQFIGNEYIRFRGRRRLFRELGGGVHEMSPTVLQRVADCDPNLIQFGLPDGSLLPEFSEELYETVSRCVGCIAVERQAEALLRAISEDVRQPQLPGFDEVMKEVE